MASRFVAPKKLESLEDARKALQRVQEQLDALSPARVGALITKDTTLRAGEFVRISPRQGATLTAKLPKADARNLGQSITISIERPNGTLKIAAERPDTVSGLLTASFTLAGLIVLVSNGVDQWVLTNQLPANSPGALAISAGTNSQNSGTVVFSASNNVTFGMGTNGVVTASVTVASTQGSIGVSAGTTSVLSSRFTFANSNNVSFGIDTNGVVTASATVASTQGSIRISAGTTSVLSSAFTFSNSNNVSFGINTNGVVTASATVASTQGSIGVSAGTTSVLSSRFTFSNSNNVSFGINTNGVVTASVTVASTQGSIGVSAGTTSVLSSRFTFADANNVSFGINTNGVVTASASFAGGGGIALADAFGQTVTNGTVHLPTGAVTNVSSLWSGDSRSANVVMGLTGSTITANAYIAFDDVTGGNGSVATRLNFLSSNGITFGVATANNTNGARMINVTASYAPLAISAVIEAGAGSVSAGTVVLREYTATNDGRTAMQVVPLISDSTVQFAYDPPRFVNRMNPAVGSHSQNYSTFHNRPFFFQPFAHDPLEHFGLQDNMHIGQWFIGHNANVSSSTASASFAVTYKLGLYSLENGTGSRLSLVNSASLTLSRAAGTSAISSAMHGQRWIPFDPSGWSATSGLSAGNWWCALMVSMQTSNEARFSIDGRSLMMGAPNFGTVGVNNNAANRRPHPFQGFFTATTGAFPATVASSAINTSAADGGWIPCLSLRANVNAAFG